MLHRKLSALHCNACNLDIGKLLISVTVPILMALAQRPKRLRKTRSDAIKQRRAFKLDHLLDHLPDQVRQKEVVPRQSLPSDCSQRLLQNLV